MNCSIKNNLRNIERMNNKMKALRWLSLIGGILLVILGAFMIGTPAENIAALSILLYISLFATSIIQIVAYFSFDKGFRSAWLLVDGILMLILAVWLLFNNGIIAMAAVLPYVFAIWCVASSIMMAVSSIDLKDFGVKGWGWSLAVGIIGTLLGFVLMFSPVVAALTLSYLLAFIVLYRGISDIIFFFTTKIIN